MIRQQKNYKPSCTNMDLLNNSCFQIHLSSLFSPLSLVHVHGESKFADDPMLSRNLSLDDAEWVELFVREMSAASDVEDARIRASRALEAFEKSIYARAKDETAQNFQQVIY